jgi:hypothetical protein
MSQPQNIPRDEAEQPSFQQRVTWWLVENLGPNAPGDKEERVHQFLKQAFELAKASGLKKAQAKRLVEQIFSTPCKRPDEQAGAVLVTLSALCAANGTSMLRDGENELKRISDPTVAKRIVQKQIAATHQ